VRMNGDVLAGLRRFGGASRSTLIVQELVA
jgi:hypothetical protein